MISSSILLSFSVITYRYTMILSEEPISSVFNNVYRSAQKLDHHVLGEKDVYVKFVSASTPCTHAWTPEKNCLIKIILQCNTEHKNVFLHIPVLKITQIKIPRNVVDVFDTLTTWHHMKTSSLKRKDQTSFGFVYASILIKYN